MMNETRARKTKTKSLLIALALGLTSIVLMTPGVAAHLCTAEEGNAGEESCQAECTDGEYHDHTITHHHENGLGEDENHVHYHCESTYEPPTPPPGSCTPSVLGICLQEIIDPEELCGSQSEGVGVPTLPPTPAIPDLWDRFVC